MVRRKAIFKFQTRLFRQILPQHRDDLSCKASEHSHILLQVLVGIGGYKPDKGPVGPVLENGINDPVDPFQVLIVQDAPSALIPVQGDLLLSAFLEDELVDSGFLICGRQTQGNRVGLGYIPARPGHAIQWRMIAFVPVGVCKVTHIQIDLHPVGVSIISKDIVIHSQNTLYFIAHGLRADCLPTAYLLGYLLQGFCNGRFAVLVKGIDKQSAHQKQDGEKYNSDLGHMHGKLTNLDSTVSIKMGMYLVKGCRTKPLTAGLT